jgi:hypothetical protein
LDKTFWAIAVYILLFTASSFADDKVLAPNGQPTKEDVAGINSFLDAEVNKVYIKEKGKRDKQTIKAELYNNNVNIPGNVTSCINASMEKDYEGAHLFAHTGIDTSAKYKKQYPNINVDNAKLAVLCLCDAGAYVEENKLVESIETYEKGNYYNKLANVYYPAGVYLQLGTFYMMNKDRKNGNRYFKLAIQLDSTLETSYKETMARLKKAGYIE